VTTVDDIPFVVPDERIAARIDAEHYAELKMAAVRAHATQIPTDSWLYVLADGFGKQFLGVEYYELVVGTRGPGGPDGVETDLFAGLF
jgi:N-acetyl-1-D-myo-inositol-2-amino-2-deoxy-alpha-D-glucopyranoside deacetylase